MKDKDLAPHHDVHTETPLQKEQRINREVNAFIDSEISRLQKEIDHLRGELVKLAKGGGLTKPHCRKCATEMITSKAIEQTYTGSPDFPGDKKAVTLSPSGKGKMIDCYKCPCCGWSVTK